MLFCSDFGAHPPWNTIVVVGAIANFLLLWLLWVGFPMWMWSGRGLIIQVYIQKPAFFSSATCLTAQQHRGDMAGPPDSVLQVMTRISGQFASEYLVYQGLQEEVKKAFATGNFK
jgi:hypothetical protein